MRHQQPTQRRPKTGARRRHRRQQAHRTACPRLRHRIGHQRHCQSEHDRRADALHRPCADQPTQSGSQRTGQRSAGENADPDQQQSTSTKTIAQTPDADDQRGDRQQVSEHDPLHLLKRRLERRREDRQAGVGDAGVQGRHQHRQGQTGQRPAGGSAQRFLGHGRLTVQR
ncbi:hypothetical protein D3C72_797060 [compost metagenome]